LDKLGSNSLPFSWFIPPSKPYMKGKKISSFIFKILAEEHRFFVILKKLQVFSLCVK